MLDCLRTLQRLEHLSQAFSPLLDDLVWDFWQLTNPAFAPPDIAIMGISRDSRHKRSASGAKRAYYRASSPRP